MTKFFVAYSNDRLACLAIKILGELGGKVASIDADDIPSDEVTLLFTPSQVPDGFFSGKKHFCTSPGNMRKRGLEIPKAAKMVSGFVALRPRPIDSLSPNSDDRQRFSQALCQLDPQLVKKFKKPRKKRERNHHRDNDYFAC